MTVGTRAALAAVAEGVWYGDGVSAWAARALLHPASWVYGRVAAVRAARSGAHAGPGAGHDAPPPLPALSVGNLTVGGTGKTPVASWAATALLACGARPAILLRGYGDDEWRVHQQLQPGAPVLVGADRLASLRAAAARGCDCAVLDDAFQHHRAPRVVDWVLVSADRWPRRVRLLPAGPFREPLDALRRASAMIVTVKAADSGRVAETASRLSAAAPGVPLAIVRLTMGALYRAAGAGNPGGPVAPEQAGSLTAVSAIGDPLAFESQLERLGARLTARVRFPDHHAFSAADIDHLVREGARGAGVVCTLKDAVKLAPRWPAMAAPLWYVSQAVLVESGHEVLVGGLDRVLATRPGAALTAG